MYLIIICAGFLGLAISFLKLVNGIEKDSKKSIRTNVYILTASFLACLFGVYGFCNNRPVENYYLEGEKLNQTQTEVTFVTAQGHYTLPIRENEIYPDNVYLLSMCDNGTTADGDDEIITVWIPKN